jgi:hypothetical protein
MRKRFDPQKEIFLHEIERAKIPQKCRDAAVGMYASIKEIYIKKEFRDRILDIISKSIPKKKPTGRKGMNLWQIFVLAQSRLCLGIGYDRLHYLVNQDILLRHLLGIRDIGDQGLIQWDYQRIYDNVTLLNDETLKEINTVIVELGHEVFKKKETEALRLKTDSYVVRSNVHFPTDYSLLWDSARKSLDTVNKIMKKHPELQGWRKLKDWHRSLKSLMQQVGRASRSGGKNKEARVMKATKHYLEKSRRLYTKLETEKKKIPVSDVADIALQCMLDEYKSLLDKHIDLVDRRLLQGEKIPHEEKLFSIFEQYTEWISKGKLYPNVELGKKLAITTDQYNLIVDYQIMESQADSQIVECLADRVLSKYRVGSWSFDKGFWHKKNKAYLSDKIEHVIMPKKGKCNREEQAYESTKEFKKLRHTHSAIESNINELEHRGMDRCPDRTYPHFKRYIGLGIISYNLHKIGKEIIRQEKAKKVKEQKQLNKRKKKAA